MNRENGLTTDEECVMDLILAVWDAWNGRFVQPGATSAEEESQFREGMHLMQEIFAQRALSRTYPKYWSVK